MTNVAIQDVDYKAIAEKMAEACRLIQGTCPRTYAMEAARHALDAYHKAIGPPDDHPGWDRLLDDLLDDVQNAD